MRSIFLAGFWVVAVSGCAPDVSQVAGGYAQAVGGAEKALADTVRANAAARKTSDYQLIALERPKLQFTAPCNEVFDLAAWSGGQVVVTDGAPSDADRQQAIQTRADRLKVAAEECAVTEGAPTPLSEARGDQLPDPRLRDPIYLCGIDPSRLDVSSPAPSLTGTRGAEAMRIPPRTPDVAAQTLIMPALASYAQALKEAAEAEDIAALEAAAQRTVNSLTALATLAGPYGVVVAPAVKAVGTAAATLTGAFLREKRFRFIKDVVVASDPAVRDSVAVVCHSALLLSYEIVRSEMFQLDDLLISYNTLAIDSDNTFQSDENIVGVVRKIDSSVVSVREIGTADYIGSILGIAAAHRSLRQALESPEPDFQATIKLLEKLVGQFEDIRKATSALTVTQAQTE